MGPNSSWDGSATLFEPSQTTSFTISNVPTDVGSLFGRFTVLAKGDYSIGTTSEFLDWSIDGIVSGQDRPGTGTVIAINDPDHVEWTQSFTIAQADLASIFADGVFTVTLDNSPEV